MANLHKKNHFYARCNKKSKDQLLINIKEHKIETADSEVCRFYFVVVLCLLIHEALDTLLGSLLKLLALYLYARNLTISSEVLV